VNIYKAYIAPIDKLDQNTQVGKFITIYPGSDRQAVEIAELLDEIYQKSPWSYLRIPAARQIGDGAVFTRYGQFHREYGENVLKNPSGELVPDIRGDNWIPDWLRDPFEPVFGPAAPASAPKAREGS